MRVLPYGPAAWLVELDEDEVAPYTRALRGANRPGVREIVPGARTVLVRTDPAATEDLRPWLLELPPLPASAGAELTIEIPVRYDGPDLAEVAASTGLTVDDVIDRHRAATYTCAFCGFSPGFAYLRGLDDGLVLPRRPTPRTRVPAGAVAIADRYSAVYPSPSPGGWHLIGHTDASLWDPRREPPALIQPGATVRFVPR
jgi:KipI family sensor histidine kinase inhibitor